MKLSTTETAKPGEFEAGGSSPPRPAIPSALAEELAEIIAQALVADYLAEVPGRSPTLNQCRPGETPSN